MTIVAASRVAEALETAGEEVTSTVRQEAITTTAGWAEIHSEETPVVLKTISRETK